MTTINIYENSNGELDLTEIQETLTKILKENKELKNKLTKIEDKLKYINNNNTNAKDIVKENKETLTKALENIPTKTKNDKDTVTPVKLDTETKLNYKKYNLNDFQQELLNSIPIVDNPTEYEKQMTQQYIKLNHNEKKEWLNKQCTITTLKDKFNITRNVIMGNLFRKNKPRYDLFHAFKITPDNPKATQILYREKTLPKHDNQKRKYHKKNVNDKWEITTESAKKNYNNLRLLPHFKLKHDSSNGRTFELYYDMFDVFYIKSIISKDKFTNKDFNEILKHNKHQWTVKNLSQIIYNIENNIDLQKLIIDTRKFFNTDNTFDETNGILKINDVNTHIRVEQAKEWCIAYMNNGKQKDEFIWNLQRRFPEIKREFITMIIYNHNNDELCELWKEEEKPVFIENNPSKRRNIIRSGGIV